MGENSKIEWCDHTMNFWIGCTEAGPECDHCYARTLAERYGWAKWGVGQPRHRTSPETWAKPHAWDRKAAKLGIRYRVFTNSLADWADKEVADAWRDESCAVMDATPNLDWLILTKRPKVMRDYFRQRGAVPGNVWAGTTIGTKAGLSRLRYLRAINAKVRFLSIEPLLGYLGEIDLTGIHWVIVGGESGKDARPMHPDWARSLRDQCQAAGVPFLFKQWGSCLPGNMDGEDERGHPAYEIDEEHSSIDYDELGKGKLVMAHGYEFIKFPHKNTGRTLDGREWNEVPQP
jgi:protein gp37